MKLHIVVLAGDGIGPEVTAEAERVLGTVAATHGHNFEFEHQLIGAAVIEES